MEEHPPLLADRASQPERHDRYDGNSVRALVAVSGTHNNAQCPGFSYCGQIESFAELQQGLRSGVHLPRTKLHLKCAPVTAAFLNNHVDFKIGIVAVVVYPRTARAAVDTKVAIDHRFEQEAQKFDVFEQSIGSRPERNRRRDTRPAPVWRVMSSVGTDDPVRMNCPQSPR